MMTLYTWSTPNGRKISIALEEMALPYRVVPVDITRDEQFAPSFLAKNINHKIPILETPEGRIITESGAILFFLAEKTQKFMPPKDDPHYWDVMSWMMWQMSAFGPNLGQAHHFLKYNRGRAPYAEARFAAEARRLYGILEERLDGREHIIDTGLSIVDFAIWPWISRFEWHQIDLADFPRVFSYYKRLSARPAFQKGYKIPVDMGEIPMPTLPIPSKG